MKFILFKLLFKKPYSSCFYHIQMLEINFHTNGIKNGATERLLR